LCIQTIRNRIFRALERQDYDLVLMHVKMPEMDGITATQVIRKLRPENAPKIIAITAFALKGDRENVLKPEWMTISSSR
jgi:CheY-like chemotaxis protein